MAIAAMRVATLSTRATATALPQSPARALSPQRCSHSWVTARSRCAAWRCASIACRGWLCRTQRLLTCITQSSMQLAQQVRDPLGHGFGNLGSCGQFEGDGCLDFFDDQVLARRLQGFSCTVSTSHAGTRRVEYLGQRKDWTFRSEVRFAVGGRTRLATRELGTGTLLYAGLERWPRTQARSLCHARSKSTPRTV